MMDISTPKAVLIAARALIDTPDKWGTGTFKNPETGCLCALGAIVVATGIANDEELFILADLATEHADEIAGRIIPELNAMPAVRMLVNAIAVEVDENNEEQYTNAVWEFNDKSSHREVMIMFDEAIAAA